MPRSSPDAFTLATKPFSWISVAFFASHNPSPSHRLSAVDTQTSASLVANRMMRWLCWRKGRCKRLHVFLPMLLHPLFPFHVQLPLFIAYPFDSAIPFYFPYFSFFLCIPNDGYVPTLLLKDNDTIRLSDIVVQPWCVFVPTSSACVPPPFVPPRKEAPKEISPKTCERGCKRNGRSG